MTKTVFTLDGKKIEVDSAETIWKIASRHGNEIPHLCYRDSKDYVENGNCRTCVVEIEGEKALAPSCLRKPTNGMVVHTKSERSIKAREMVLELLLSNNPEPRGNFKYWLGELGIKSSRIPGEEKTESDLTHPAMAVDLNKCIHCKLCIQACREIQCNDVIGMSGRGSSSLITFDINDDLGNSTCVGCGECVQVCPTDALATLDGFDLQDDKAFDRKVESVCPYCGVGCQVELFAKDEKLVHVEGKNGPANHSRLCVKGRFGLDYVNSKQRLTVPLVRKEGVKKDSILSLDPNYIRAQFREASWEESLELASRGFKVGIREFGSESFAGFGSAKGSNEEAYLFQKLIRTGFKTNNVDHCTRLCHASSVAALLETIGSAAVTAPVINCLDSDLIIVAGANPTVNHPVAASFMKNAVKSGAEMIVMDPRLNGLKNYSSHFLQFAPGTDVALLNGIINVIIEEKLYNKQYVDTFTEGFSEYSQHISKYPPEKMEPICKVTATEIRAVARKIASANSAMIFWGMGIAQHTHGTDNARCLIALALLCGHIGKKGAGLHPLRGQNNVQGASDAGLIPMMYPDYKLVEDFKSREFFEEFWQVDLDKKAGLTVVEIMDAVYKNEIRFMYIMGENPAMSDPDTAHARKALSKLNHLVVQDIFLTETAAFADVIFPASAWPEKDGSVTNTDRRVQLGSKVINSPGDARPDWLIIRDLANLLGLNWAYDSPQDIHNEMTKCMPSMENIPWKRLEEEGSVTYPTVDKKTPGQEIIFSDGFPTKTGKGKLVPVSITPPDEKPDKNYPLVLTTGRLLEHWHTGAMTRRAAKLNALEPHPTIHLSPIDIQRLDLELGEIVEVSTKRGRVKLAVREEPFMPEGLIFLPFCYFEAAANILTNPALDPVAKIPELKYAAAQLTKIVS